MRLYQRRGKAPGHFCGATADGKYGEEGIEKLAPRPQKVTTIHPLLAMHIPSFGLH